MRQPKLLILLGLLAILLIGLAQAAPLSTTYNGKTYYVVASSDAGSDTGNEVCAQLGQTCVGFTAFTTDVCKAFHPSAAVQSGVDGSSTGFYCNGPPQAGVCAQDSDTCRICPACNVNIDCATPVGSLYREMYVECSGGPQQPSGQAKTIYDFLKSVQGGPNAEINREIPASVKEMLGTNIVQMIITEPLYFVWFESQDGTITSSGQGLLLNPSPTMRVSLSKATLESILNSQDQAAAVLAGIKSGDIRIEYPKGGPFFPIGLGALKLFGPKGSAQAPPVQTVTDNSGSDTDCNQGWDGPKQISCFGPYQAQGTGKGQGCCESACGADPKCDEQAPGSVLGGSCSTGCKFIPTQFVPVFSPFPQKPAIDPRIGNHPDQVVCEFYQVTNPGDFAKSNKKLVTCGGYKAADNFCVIAMQSQYARAATCEDHGIIVCTNPCNPPSYQLPIARCAFDNDRPRGYNAPPISFCSGPQGGAPQANVPPPGKKLPGEVCKHGGECTTGNCVGMGSGPPWTYGCSCDPFRFTTFGCK